MLARCILTLAAILTPLSTSAQTIGATTESTPHAGIRLVEGRTSNPNTNFYAAYVSLCTDYVHVDASAYGSARSSASWGSSVGAELAVNGDFYTGTPRLHVYGDAVAGGSRWALNRTGLHSDYAGDWYYHRYGWIAFGPDWVEHNNTERVKQQGLSSSGYRPTEVAPDPPPGTIALVSGFPQLVIDGAPVTCSSPTATSCFPDRGDMRERHPRTAMGLSRDRKTFMLVVVDGRSTSSVGMYGAELAKLMADLGAHTAFNLDGGGSSQMWVAGEGTINRPSDGTPRAVVNHWGVFAASNNGLPRQPGSCDNSWDGLVHALAGQLGATTDLDGDGRGDACIRTETGVQCALHTDAGFSAPIVGPALSDESGWSDPSNYATMRWGDLDGDGRADLCARANAGVRCWKFDGTAFGDAITGPALSDDDGFDHESTYSTLRLGDVTGDGRDDLCARWPQGIRCYPSTGDGFGEAIDGPVLSDETGWRDPDNYGTLRMGDVDGDGKADFCARANARMHCWITDGERLDGPEWSDAAGWSAFRHWSTIRLVDLDDDGRADLCGRSPTGLQCHLSTGDGFGPAIAGPALTDETGWADYSNFSTLRFADVTGDGLLDACGRADAGMRCWPFDGASFGEALQGPAADATGWTADRFHRTIDFVDIDADGRADMCARASRGLVCWRSLGDRFDDALIEGPAWSDEAGFGAARFYGTMRMLGPVRRPPVDPEPPADADAGPLTDPVGGDMATGGAPDPGNASGDAGPAGEADVISASGGCGCAAASGGADSLFAALIVGAAIAARRRRR